MLKKVIKCAAIICVMSLTFSLCGCSDTSWAVKVGNTTMPSGIYLFWLTQVSANIKQNTSSGTDPWSQTISKTTAETYARTNALDYTKQVAEIENLCAKLKITATANDISSAISFASSQMSANSATYSSNGISSASLQRLYKDFAILRPKLFTAIYSAGGEKAVSDAELTKFYVDNFVKVKHIVLLTTDPSTNAAITGKALEDLKKNAASVLAEAKGANFDQLMIKYSQDTPDGTVGKPSNAEGYIFTRTSAAQSNFDQTFVDTAFSMNVGEIKQIEASYGYDIMLKLKIDENNTYFDTNKTSILGEMKAADFEAYIQDKIAKDKVVINDAAINYYKPKNLK